MKIGETEYDVQPITPELSPFIARIGEVMKTKPKDVEEAKAIRKEIAELSDIIFPETVTPDPAKEHKMQLLQTVLNLTAQVMDEADCFRKKK